MSQFVCNVPVKSGDESSLCVVDLVFHLRCSEWMSAIISTVCWPFLTDNLHMLMHFIYCFVF